MRKNRITLSGEQLEVLKIAVIYGADAVYIGGEAFGLRAKAKNFSMEEMAEGVAFCACSRCESVCYCQYFGSQL